MDMLTEPAATLFPRRIVWDTSDATLEDFQLRLPAILNHEAFPRHLDDPFTIGGAG